MFALDLELELGVCVFYRDSHPGSLVLARVFTLVVSCNVVLGPVVLVFEDVG